MNELILFIIASLPVLLICYYVYKKDKNKEPTKLLLKLFLGGILSCFLVFIFSMILELIFPLFRENEETLNLIQLLVVVFIKVAFIEELCKWLVVYKLSFNNQEFDEIYDMLVYAVFVSLGFAFFENLLYVKEYGIMVGLVRAILSVPSHACNAIFMGYYLAISKIAETNHRKDLMIKNKILSIIIPTITHGIFDYCLFTEKKVFICLFIIYVVFLYIVTIKRIKKISKIESKINYKNNYCPNCGAKVNGNYCVICGHKIF